MRKRPHYFEFSEYRRYALFDDGNVVLVGRNFNSCNDREQAVRIKVEKLEALVAEIKNKQQAKEFWQDGVGWVRGEAGK